MRAPGVLVVLLVLLTGCASTSPVAGAAGAPDSSAGKNPSISGVVAVSPPPPDSIDPQVSPSTQPPTRPPTPSDQPLASGAYASAATAAGAVAWADLPYQSPVESDPLAHPAGSPPWCRADDLTISGRGFADGAASYLFFSWTLTARAGHRCSLQGNPVVHLTDASHTWGLISEPSDTFGLQPGNILDPKHPGTIGFRWGHDQEGYGVDVRPAPRLVTFDLPHSGGALRITDADPGYIPDRPAPAVPLHPGRLVADHLAGSGPPVYGGIHAAQFSALLASAPKTAGVGSVVDYRAWISPASGPGAYAGPPCFGYREQLIDWHTGIVISTEQHELNCQGLSTLPAYGRWFELRLQLPASVPAGAKVYVRWEGDLAGLYADSDPVTVTTADS
jgi:hypothetical protein